MSSLVPLFPLPMERVSFVEAFADASLRTLTQYRQAIDPAVDATKLCDVVTQYADAIHGWYTERLGNSVVEHARTVLSFTWRFHNRTVTDAAPFFESMCAQLLAGLCIAELVAKKGKCLEDLAAARVRIDMYFARALERAAQLVPRHGVKEPLLAAPSVNRGLHAVALAVLERRAVVLCAHRQDLELSAVHAATALSWFRTSAQHMPYISDVTASVLRAVALAHRQAAEFCVAQGEYGVAEALAARAADFNVELRPYAETMRTRNAIEGSSMRVPTVKLEAQGLARRSASRVVLVRTKGADGVDAVLIKYQ